MLPSSRGAVPKASDVLHSIAERCLIDLLITLSGVGAFIEHTANWLPRLARNTDLRPGMRA